MKISKELFEKLSKKDQEEYKKEIDKVRNIEFPNLWISYMSWMIYFVGFMFLALPLGYIAFKDTIPTLLLSLSRIWITGVRLIFILVIIGFVIDFIIMIIKISKLDNIKHKYFKIKVEVKKDGNNIKR